MVPGTGLFTSERTDRMRLEFVGPPGAGKTTIMAACKRRKSKRLVRSKKTEGRFMSFVRQCYMRAEIKRDGHLQTLKQYQRAIAADKMPEWHWYSELLAQRGLSLALARPGQFGLVGQFFEMMPPPALLVWVNGPPELLIERNRARARRGQDDRSDCVPYLCEVTEVARAVYADRGPVLVLDAAAPVAENAAKVLEAVG